MQTRNSLNLKIDNNFKNIRENDPVNHTDEDDKVSDHDENNDVCHTDEDDKVSDRDENKDVSHTDEDDKVSDHDESCDNIINNIYLKNDYYNLFIRNTIFFLIFLYTIRNINEINIFVVILIYYFCKCIRKYNEKNPFIF